MLLVSSTVCILSVIVLCLFVLATGTDIETSIESSSLQNEERYAVVVDAGSTGSRAYLFKVSGEGSRRVSTLRRTGAEGGIASFINEPEQVKSCILPLLLKVAKMIPEELWGTTEVSIHATGGMRSLSEADQEIVWNALEKGLVEDSSMPFPLHRENLGTITGTKEAYFAVLSANYIAERIDDHLRPIPGTKLIGALDMGGSSTQMIYHLGSEGTDEGDFWSHSWAAYGATSAREKVWAHIIGSHLEAAEVDMELPEEENMDGMVSVEIPMDGSSEGKGSTALHIPNPCSYRGHEEEVEHLSESGRTHRVRFSGEGDPVRCARLIRSTLWNSSHTHHRCRSPEHVEGTDPDDRVACSLNHVSLPHTPVQYEYYAMSAYFFAFDCIRELGTVDLPNWPTPSIGELDHAIHAFCEEHHWDDVSAKVGQHRYTTHNQIVVRCFESLYLINVLKHAFGFPDSFRGVNFAPGLNSGGFSAVDWPLGYFLTTIASAAESEATQRLLKGDVENSP